LNLSDTKHMHAVLPLIHSAKYYECRVIESQYAVQSHHVNKSELVPMSNAGKQNYGPDELNTINILVFVTIISITYTWQQRQAVTMHLPL
jgi:hypothetical protein